MPYFTSIVPKLLNNNFNKNNKSFSNPDLDAEDPPEGFAGQEHVVEPAACSNKHTSKFEQIKITKYVWKMHFYTWFNL